MRSPFVSPDVKRLDLSDGLWIEVKERISYGEQKRLQIAGLSRRQHLGAAQSDGLEFDFAAYDLVRLETWLVDWNFPGTDGRTAPVDRVHIEALDPAVAAEINEALSAHIEQIEARQSDPPTVTSSAPKLRSVAGSAGGRTAS